MTDKIDMQLAQTAVLLSRQYLLTNHLIETRGKSLYEFEAAIKEERQTLDHVLDVYNYVFALIDHLVRYQKIAFVLPRFSQKMDEFKEFHNSMGKLKDIRNQLQHINNDIENDYSGPLLGAVCWASNQKSFIASFHDIGRSRSSSGLILDTHTGQYTQEFCYVYNDTYHDLGKAIKGIYTFNEFINSSLKIDIDGKTYEPKKHFVALCIDLKQNNGDI